MAGERAARREVERLVQFYYYEGESDWKVRPYLDFLERGEVSRAVAEKLEQVRARGRISFAGAKGARFARFAVPAGCPLRELVELDGVGPRTAVRLCVDRGVRSLADLEALPLPRAVRVSLAVRGRVLRRVPRAAVAAAQRAVRRRLAARFEMAGSYRRGAATSGDLDIVVQSGPAAPDLQAVLRALDPLLEADLTSRSARTKYSGHFRAPRGRLYRVDIRLVPPESFATALLYFTGSARFNTTMRAHAKSLGFCLNEYGLWRDGRRVPTPDERAVFAALDLPYVPPARRSLE